MSLGGAPCLLRARWRGACVFFSSRAISRKKSREGSSQIGAPILPDRAVRASALPASLKISLSFATGHRNGSVARHRWGDGASSFFSPVRFLMRF